MRTLKTQIRQCYWRADLNLRWAHRYEVTFFCLCGSKNNVWLILVNLSRKSMVIQETRVSYTINYMYPTLSLFVQYITKTCLYNFDPLEPHFYIEKLGFTGVYIILLIFVQNIDCGYSLEPPRRGGSNEYPQSMFSSEIGKISVFFLSENVQFLEVKISIYLNSRVFVMKWAVVH